MQQHPHIEILSSIKSMLRNRTASCLTTHLDKIKAHNNSMGNDQAGLLANVVADGQPHDAIYFKDAHTYLRHLTWLYTTQPNDPNPPETLH
jgi:hypothetical protein